MPTRTYERHNWLVDRSGTAQHGAVIEKGHRYRRGEHPYRLKSETNGWKWPLFMVGYLSAGPHNDVMPMPISRARTGNHFKEVETVRLFTSAGHPWIGFAALLVLRLPPIVVMAYLIIRGSPF